MHGFTAPVLSYMGCLIDGDEQNADTLILNSLLGLQLCSPGVPIIIKRGCPEPVARLKQRRSNSGTEKKRLRGEGGLFIEGACSQSTAACAARPERPHTVLDNAVSCCS